jgi:hypothetical protein
MNKKITRLARAGKWVPGKIPGRPLAHTHPVGASSDANAALPIPVAVRPKK